MPWWSGGFRDCRWSTSWAGRSSAGFGSKWTRAFLCPAAAPGSWSGRPRSSWPAPAARGVRPSSSTCAADQGRSGPRWRRWPAPWSSTPRTSTPPRCGARSATSFRSAVRSMKGTSTSLSRRGCAGGSTSLRSTPRMFPRRKSAPCRRKPACTSRGFPSTAAQTGCRSSSGWPPRRRNGWRPGGHLLVETSRRQAPRTVGLFIRNGLTARVASSGELDATVVIGTAATGATGWPASGPV